jgi:YHS domain-containing protein
MTLAARKRFIGMTCAIVGAALSTPGAAGTTSQAMTMRGDVTLRNSDQGRSQQGQRRQEKAEKGQEKRSEKGAEHAKDTEAKERVRNTEEWNLQKKSRLAIKGYDPVAYFPEGGGEPKKGKPEFAFEFKGVTYHFASQENLDRFKADPAKYEPAYGGWCAWAMRDGDKVQVDPKSFLVQGNRLLLFYDGWLGDTRAKWLNGDAKAECAEADAAWKKISSEEPPAVDAPDIEKDGGDKGEQSSGG